MRTCGTLGLDIMATAGSLRLLLPLGCRMGTTAEDRDRDLHRLCPMHTINPRHHTRITRLTNNNDNRHRPGHHNNKLTTRASRQLGGTRRLTRFGRTMLAV